MIRRLASNAWIRILSPLAAVALLLIVPGLWR